MLYMSLPLICKNFFFLLPRAGFFLVKFPLREFLFWELSPHLRLFLMQVCPVPIFSYFLSPFLFCPIFKQKPPVVPIFCWWSQNLFQNWKWNINNYSCMCYRVRFSIKQVVCWLMLAKIIFTFVLSMTSQSSVNNLVTLLLFA